MKHPLSGLPAPTAGRAAARAAAALLAGCGPSHDAPANAGQASAKAQQNGPASVAVARGKIEVEGGLLDLSPAVAGVVQQRSEDHTSELQSPCNLVCRLLLEKKKSCNITDGLVVVYNC